MKLKKRVFRIIEVSEGNDRSSRSFDFFITGLIFLNVIAVILETVPAYKQSYESLFSGFEIFSVFIFTIEYFLRIWSCSEISQRYKGFTGKIRFLFTPFALIDLLAILPFYLPVFLPDLRILRVVRLFRILRLFKMTRYTKSLKVFAKVLKAKKEDLCITLFAVIIILVFVSSIIYYVEFPVQPEVFSSIPQAMWWGVATLTTVGYGDVYPITPAGKFLGSLVALLGIGLFAMPAGILASGFSEALKKEAHTKCPHCGKRIEN